jgi:hypothetical protein
VSDIIRDPRAPIAGRTKSELTELHVVFSADVLPVRVREEKTATLLRNGVNNVKSCKTGEGMFNDKELGTNISPTP